MSLVRADSRCHVRCCLPSLRFVSLAMTLAAGAAGSIPRPASAVQLHFVADPINAANECPFCPAANGTGCGAFTLETTTNTVTFYIVHNQAGETASHVHGPAGPCPATAGILQPLPLGLVKQGSYVLTPAQATDMQNGRHYVNIHTGPCGPGAIRGQIVRAQNPEACCLTDGTCLMTDPTTCLCLGGAPQGAGTACTTPTACCLPDGSCVDVDPLCCDDLGGVPQALGTSCTSIVCPQPECEPLPDQSACRMVECPDPAVEQCIPRCLSFNPSTGQILVTDCDCRSPNECHPEPVAGGLFDCFGSCPAGLICERTSTTLPDGTIQVCCDCVPPPVCQPTPDRTACEAILCPIAGEECLPRCVIFDPVNFQIEIDDCDCRTQNDCHVDAFSGTFPPPCVGGCPPGFQCVEEVITLPDGRQRICCDCVPEQPYKNWVIADDFCIPSQCPPCVCDFDGDGACTTFGDLQMLLNCFGPVVPGCEFADLNCDGVVDNLDEQIWVCLAAGNPPDQCCPVVNPPPTPITDIQWYGSYLDPDFDPKITPTPRPIDGWLVAIHRDVPPQPCPPGANYDACGTITAPDALGCQFFTPNGSVTPIPLDVFGTCCAAGIPGPFPPGQWRICGIFNPDCTTPCSPVPGVLCVLSIEECETGISRPGKMILQWAFDPAEVLVANTGKIGWDQHFIFCYGPVRLSRGCLQHNNADPDEIDVLNGIFFPRPGVNYWISIQAEVGHRIVRQPQPCCFSAGGCQVLPHELCIALGGIPQPGELGCADIDCANPNPPAPPYWIEEPTGNTVDRDFWGWHTTPPGYDRKDDAFMGMLAMGCRGGWIYQWMNHLHWSQPQYIECADDPTKSIDMAFYLICSNNPQKPQGQIVWCQPVNPGPPPPDDPPPPVRPVPNGAIDELIDTVADATVELFPPGPGVITMQANGPTRVWRSNPLMLANQTIIQTEILSMDLVGISPLGPITIQERGDAQSKGEIQIVGPDPWPVPSFFDVFVEINVPGAPPGFQNLITQGPVRVDAVGGLWELPPSAADFQGPPGGTPVLLFDRSNPTKPVGQLRFISHRVGYRGGIDIHSDTDWANMPMVCTCPGDVNEDSELNAKDIQGFINCLLGQPLPPLPVTDCPCLCADMDGDGLVTFLDIVPFVNQLLASPKAVCPPDC